MFVRSLHLYCIILKIILCESKINSTFALQKNKEEDEDLNEEEDEAKPSGTDKSKNHSSTDSDSESESESDTEVQKTSRLKSTIDAIVVKSSF